MKKRFLGMVILFAGCTALTACGKTTGTVEESVSAESVAEKESEEKPEATLTEEDVVSAIKEEVESEIASDTTGGSRVLEQTLMDGLEIIVNEMEETDNGYNVMVSFSNYDVAAGLEQMQNSAAGDGAEDYADQLASVLETTAKVSSDFEMFISVSDGECSLQLSEEQFDAAIGGLITAYGQHTEILDRMLSDFDTWMLFNETSFDTMTDGMKLDLCAYIFYLQGTYEMTNEGSCIFQNTDLQGILNDYIDSSPALVSENSTEKLEIQSDISVYPAGDWGDTTMSHTIDRVEYQGNGQYAVTVTYIETYVGLGEDFTYGTVEYIFKAKLGSKYGCVLVDASFEYCFEEEMIDEQMSVVNNHSYTNDELVELARNYYAAHSDTGYVPEYVEVDSEDGDYVTIHLYDIVALSEDDVHTATSDWYIVSRYDATGTNLLDEYIDLKTASN